MLAASSFRAQALLPLLVLVFSLSPAAAGADPGDLLTSFGIDGVAFEGLGQGHIVRDVILHPSLGLLVATYERVGSPHGLLESKLRLVQMDPETGAVLTTVTYPPLFEDFREMHLKNDGLGGVIVGATVVVDADDTDVLIFRLTPGLAIDPSFGFRQVGFNLVPTDAFEQLEDLVVLFDGRIVAVAAVSTPTGFQSGLIFLHPDGTLDTSISVSGLPAGLAFVPFQEEGRFFPVAMEVDSVGRLWVAASRFGLTSETLAVARFFSSATPDTSFAGDGSTLLEYRECALCPAKDAKVVDLTVLGDRAYLAVETADTTDSYVVHAVARLSDTGGVDPFFGVWRTVDFLSLVPGGPPTANTERPSLESDSTRDGIVLVATNTTFLARSYVGVARLALDGEFDPGFAGGAPVLRTLGEGTQCFEAHFVVQGVSDIAGTSSSLRIATTEDFSNDVAVMAIEGFDVSIFADGFESGDLSAW